MDGMPVFPEGMTIDARLCPGVVARFLTVELAAGEPGEDEFSRPGHTAPEAIQRFLAAVELGLFQGPKPGERGEVLAARHDAGRAEGIERWTWELRLPPLDVDALRALARMLWTVPGRRAARFVEKAHEELIGVRDLDGGRATLRRVPGRIDNHLEEEAKRPVILVALERDAPPEVVAATKATLRAWADLATHGAFPGGQDYPCSAGLLLETGQELRREVFASFQDLFCAREGFDSLFCGLLRIHASAPIAHVDLR